jgi:hypothetical protein
MAIATSTSVQTAPDTSLIVLRLTIDEGRWLVTAVGIAQRLLEGLRLRGPEAQRYQIHGLAALHRIANQLPSGLSGYYPSSNDFKRDSE